MTASLQCLPDTDSWRGLAILRAALRHALGVTCTSRLLDICLGQILCAPDKLFVLYSCAAQGTLLHCLVCPISVCYVHPLRPG